MGRCSAVSLAIELIEPVAQHDEGELQVASISSAMPDCCFAAALLRIHSISSNTQCAGRGLWHAIALKTAGAARSVAAVLERNVADFVERQPEPLGPSSPGAGDTGARRRSIAEAGQHAAWRQSPMLRRLVISSGVSPRCRHCPRPGSGPNGNRAAIGTWSVAVHSRRNHFGRGGQGLCACPRGSRATGQSRVNSSWRSTACGSRPTAPG